MPPPRSLALLLVLAGMTFGVAAETYVDPVLSLEVPAGADGPVSASQDANTQVIAFRWPYPSGEASTLLQITQYDFGSALAGLAPAERGDAAESYLLQFLAGIARRRGDFESGATVRLDLGGIPAARIAWTGNAQGRGLSGVMYCVVVGTRVISFHTQDLDPVPLELRLAILGAIERVVFHP